MQASCAIAAEAAGVQFFCAVQDIYSASCQKTLAFAVVCRYNMSSCRKRFQTKCAKVFRYVAMGRTVFIMRETQPIKACIVMYNLD